MVQPVLRLPSCNVQACLLKTLSWSTREGWQEAFQYRSPPFLRDALRSKVGNRALRLLVSYSYADKGSIRLCGVSRKAVINEDEARGAATFTRMTGARTSLRVPDGVSKSRVPGLEANWKPFCSVDTRHFLVLPCFAFVRSKILRTF